MNVKKLTLDSSDFPDRLRHIAQPPKVLFIAGADLADVLARPCVTIVFSRKVTAYGQTVTAQLASELARAGVVIISGLAIGIDAIAHQAALDAGGLTMAVLPSSLERIYPASHRGLARRIIEQGGALVTEYPPGSVIAYKGNFIARNRIAAGLADVVLITEAAEKSGTLHTADFALQQGKDVLAVPGNITSPTSAGTNNLIKSGAAPVTRAADILRILGLEPRAACMAPRSADPFEQALLTLMHQGTTDGAELLAASKLDVSRFNHTLTMLEIRGQIRPLGNNHWALQ